MRSRLAKVLVTATVSTFAFFTAFGASAAFAADPLLPAPNVVGTPSITWTGSGSAPMFGDTLGAQAGWDVPGGTTSYQWRLVAFNNGSFTNIATSATLAAPASIAGDPANVGRDAVQLVLTYSVPGYEPATYTTSEVKIDWAAAPVQLTAGAVTGTPRVGEDIGVSIGTWDLPGTGLGLASWGIGPAPGVTYGSITTGGTFTIPATYTAGSSQVSSVGSYVTVSFYASLPGHAPSAWAGAISTVIQPPLVTAAVEIDGTGAVGYFHSAVEGTYSSVPDTRTYSWYSGDTAAGPWNFEYENDTFAPNLAHLGKYIRLVETVTLPGIGNTQSESTPLLIDTDDPTWITPLTQVGFTGTPVVGNTLTAVAAVWDRDNVDAEHSWYLTDGTDFFPARSGSSYTVQSGDVGLYLFVTETGTRNGGVPQASHTLVGMVTAAPTPTPTPTPSSSSSPSPTPAPAAVAVLAEAAEEGEETVEEAEEADDDKAVSGTDDAATSEASSDTPTPSNPALLPLILGGGGIIVVGGAAIWGWQLFLRKP